MEKSVFTGGTAAAQRRLFQSKCLLLSSLFILSGAGPGPERPRVILGAVLPMSGAQAPFGKEAERGIQLAWDAQKITDPAAAETWTLVIGDDLSSAKESGVVATRLLTKDKAHLLLGSVTGPATLEVADVARTRQRLLIVPLATTQSVVEGPFVARACMDEPMQGAVLGEFLATTLGSKDGAILRDDSAASAGIAAAFTAALQARGGKLVGQQVYDVATENFGPHLQALKEKGARYILLPSSYITAATVMKAARAAKLNFVFLGTESWDTPRFTTAAEEAGQGHFFVTHFAVDDTNAATAAFVTAFQAKFGRPPGSIAALSHDATRMAMDAVKRAGSNQAAVVMTEIQHASQWNGATGTIAHGAHGEFLKSGIIKATTVRGADFKARVMPLVAAGIVVPTAVGPTGASPPPSPGGTPIVSPVPTTVPPSPPTLAVPSEATSAAAASPLSPAAAPTNASPTTPLSANPAPASLPAPPQAIAPAPQSPPPGGSAP